MHKLEAFMSGPLAAEYKTHRHHDGRSHEVRHRGPAIKGPAGLSLAMK